MTEPAPSDVTPPASSRPVRPSGGTTAGATGSAVGPTDAPTGPPARTVAAVVFTVLAWASAFVAIRAVGTELSPGALALGRLLTGCVVLGLFLTVRRTWVAPTGREWLLLVVCGLAWFATYNVVLNAAEQRLDAGTTALLVGVGPVLIALLAGVLLGEGFPRWLLIGAAVAFAGAVLVGLGTRTAGSTDITGVLLALAAALTYAIGVLAQKPTLRRLPALQVTFLACAVGTVSCLPFAGALVHDLGIAHPGAIAGLVYLGVVPMALAFVTWAYALARMDAGRLGVTTYLVPPLTIVLSAVVLQEWPPLLAVLGGVVCLVGVGLTRRR